MGERILGRVRRQDMFSSFSTPYIGRGVWQGGRGTFNFRAFPVVVFFRGAGCWSGGFAVVRSRFILSFIHLVIL